MTGSENKVKEEKWKVMSLFGQCDRRDTSQLYLFGEHFALRECDFLDPVDITVAEWGNAVWHLGFDVQGEA